MSRFKPIRSDVNYLFPPALNGWFAGTSSGAIYVEIVEQLDLTGC